MIEITDKQNCCGCSACAQKCPKHCISMQEDAEGFLYPHVDATLCVDCGLCEKVCPVLHPNPEPSSTPIVYGCKNNDDSIRLKSSSGGVFTLIAESVIQNNGVVFGAKFNEQWQVVHDYTTTISGLEAFRGSKYVQSVIGECYKQAEQFLKSGQQVLFTGTSCQIHGLHSYLQKEYPNLLTVDVICHGAPSPKVFRDYLKEQVETPICAIEFRDKTYGWKNYSLKVVTDKTKHLYPLRSKNNTFMKGFLKNLYLRPSCGNCPSKGLTSHSDITLADYWGIQIAHPAFDDDKGASMVLINSKKGEDCFEKISSSLTSFQSSYSEVLKYNPSVARSSKEHKKRASFFDNYDSSHVSELITEAIKIGALKQVYLLSRRVVGRIKRMIVK